MLGSEKVKTVHEASTQCVMLARNTLLTFEQHISTGFINATTPNHKFISRYSSLANVIFGTIFGERYRIMMSLYVLSTEKPVI